MAASSPSYEREPTSPTFPNRPSTPPPLSPASFGGVTHGTFPSNSSPVKPAKSVTHGREEVEKSPSASSPNEDVNFLKNHLSSVPANSPLHTFVDSDRVKEILKMEPTGGEQEYYEPFSALLTKLSEAIYGKTLSTITRDVH